MANYRASVEDIANIVEYVRNVDPEQFAIIRDEVFEVLEEANIVFEEIIKISTKKCHPTILVILVT